MKKSAIFAGAVAVAFAFITMTKGICYALCLVFIGATVAVLGEGLIILGRWTRRRKRKRAGLIKAILPTRAKRSDR